MDTPADRAGGARAGTGDRDLGHHEAGRREAGRRDTGGGDAGSRDSGHGGGTAVRRYPLLPSSGLGWTPYAWLIYLGSFLWWPATGDAQPWEIAATFALTVVFVPLYFWGYWQSGRRVVWPALGMALLGTVGALWSPMACVFFIFGAGYVSAAGSARLGMAVIGGLLAWIAAVAIVLAPHPSFWLVGGVFTVLIGGINLHFGQMAKKNAKLRLSQEEVEHLAQVAERERIGRDLHDLLGHTLSLITLKSELAGKLFDRDPAAARREVAEIERISRRALMEVREAVQGYRASGLAAEVRRAAASLASADVECVRDVDEAALAAARRDPKVEGALAFVLREAVTNVLRHAGAGRCEIGLSVDAGVGEGIGGDGTSGDRTRGDDGPGQDATGDGGRLTLIVRDDGRGGVAPEGFGVSGMRQRIADLGGQLELVDDGGTRIRARVPLTVPPSLAAPAAPPVPAAPSAPAATAVDEPAAPPARPGDLPDRAPSAAAVAGRRR